MPAGWTLADQHPFPDAGVVWMAPTTLPCRYFAVHNPFSGHWDAYLWWSTRQAPTRLSSHTDLADVTRSIEQEIHQRMQQTVDYQDMSGPDTKPGCIACLTDPPISTLESHDVDKPRYIAGIGREIEAAAPWHIVNPAVLTSQDQARLDRWALLSFGLRGFVDRVVSVLDRDGHDTAIVAHLHPGRPQHPLLEAAPGQWLLLMVESAAGQSAIAIGTRGYDSATDALVDQWGAAAQVQSADANAWVPLANAEPFVRVMEALAS
jgi:hypothetical protein